MVAAQDFTRVTGDPAVSDDRYSEGSAWGDINGDGYDDLFVPHLFSDNTNILFVNNGDGSFAQVVAGPVVTDNGSSSGGSFGDFDNDGDADLFVTNYFDQPNFLYTNNGDGTFVRVTEGVLVEDPSFSFGASLADYDQDGWLDIFVVNGAFTDDGEPNALYRNLGDPDASGQAPTFTKVTEGALVTDGGHSSSAAWADYDGDGDADLFVANGGADDPTVVRNFLYRNDGGGVFTRRSSLATGIANSHASNGSWGDFDNDGDFDLLVTNFLGNNNDLYQNNGDGTFTRRFGDPLGQSGGDSVSASWGDYDNDGHLDVYVTNDFNENNALYRNNGDGSFARITTGDLVSDGGRSNGATWADYNRDGFLDLFVPNGQRPVTQSNILYRNNGASGNSWISVRCVGTASNRSAIGATLRALAQIDGVAVWQLRQVSGSTGFNAQNSLAAAFGLGTASFVDSLVITWPSGAIDRYAAVNANTFYEATEGVGLASAATGTALTPAAERRPGSFLRQNYPNPFRAGTTLAYTLVAPGFVTLIVYDIFGRAVATLVSGWQPAGTHTVPFETTVLTPGAYFYRLSLGGRPVATKAMLKVH